MSCEERVLSKYAQLYSRRRGQVMCTRATTDHMAYSEIYTCLE